MEYQAERGSMSNEPTKVTDRWNIGKSNLVQNVVFLLLCLTVSHLFQLNLALGSAMVHTTYTWMVVGQKAIEARVIA